MSRTSVRNVVESIRRQLNSTYRYEVVQLGAAMLATDTVLTINSDPTANLRPGSLLSVSAELMRVTAVDPGPREIHVIREWGNSQEATAHADGTEAWVNPRFTAIDILDAMYDELASWDPDLFRVEDDVFPVTWSQPVVELPAGWSDAIGVVTVRRQAQAQFQSTHRENAWPEVRFRVQRGVNLPTAVTSGIVIRLIDEVAAGQVHVTVAVPFDLDELDIDSDMVTDVGLERSMLDLLKIGVRYRLIGDNEAGRTARTAQDEPRRAEETPPGAASDESNRLYAMYIRRKNTEIMKLRGRYPVRRG